MRGWQATLQPHPDTPCPEARAITVDIACRSHNGLCLVYHVHGEVGRLRLPPVSVPARRDGLWRHTCFEAFFLDDAGPAYREFNFSPSGDWAAYAFAAYRAGADLALTTAPTIAQTRRGDGLTVRVELPAAALPTQIGRVGLSAVIEDIDGHITYWALAHPPGRADFHHTDGFILDLN